MVSASVNQVLGIKVVFEDRELESSFNSRLGYYKKGLV